MEARKGDRKRTSNAFLRDRKVKALETERRRKNLRKKKKVTPRRKVFWGVFDNVGHRVALFEHSQRDKADQKAAELSQGNTHYVSLVKEEIPDAA